MEIPQPPPTLVQRLQEHDKSLGLRFNVDEGLWEITETLKNGTVSHAFYWYEGEWTQRRFKKLPHSVEPLLVKLATIDWGRGKDNPMARYRKLIANGQEKRAKMMEKANQEAKLRFREYAAFMDRWWPTLRRQHQMGGASRQRAIKTRVAAVRDLYGGRLPDSPL